MHHTIDFDIPTVLCRLPDEPTAVKVVCGKLRQYASLADVEPEASGYIIAPFVASDECPVFLFADTKVEPLASDDLATTEQPQPTHIQFEEDATLYAQAFATIKEALNTGRCAKVVLSRKATATVAGIDLYSIFAQACRAYPHCYIALAHVPDYGTWLTATPELLYRQQGAEGYTMALAGTMAWQEYQNGTQWSDKNIREQKLVEEYITAQLRANHIPHTADSATTIKAGHLAHLHTEIRIAPSAELRPIDVLRILHPTPAVAGIPLTEALSVIEESEGHGTRGYYSGFMGFIGHATYHTRCYVALRMLHLSPHHRLTLYAGGGIMPDSTLDAEWHETELKLLTMKNILLP